MPVREWLSPSSPTSARSHDELALWRPNACGGDQKMGGEYEVVHLGEGEVAAD